MEIIQNNKFSTTDINQGFNNLRNFNNNFSKNIDKNPEEEKEIDIKKNSFLEKPIILEREKRYQIIMEMNFYLMQY